MYCHLLRYASEWILSRFMALCKCFSSYYQIYYGRQWCVFKKDALFISVNELFVVRCSAEQARRDLWRHNGYPEEHRPARGKWGRREITQPALRPEVVRLDAMRVTSVRETAARHKTTTSDTAKKDLGDTDDNIVISSLVECHWWPGKQSRKCGQLLVPNARAWLDLHTSHLDSYIGMICNINYVHTTWLCILSINK